VKSPDLRTGTLSPRPGPAEPVSPFAATAEINVLRSLETPTRDSSVFSAAADRWPLVEGYEILGELGRGGMGVVYKARQLGLNRIVALKMLLAGPFADPESQARFAVEAEAVARLQHPNIVQIFAIGTQASPLGNTFACPFFAQEYVDGGNLAARLAGTRHPPRDAGRLVQSLARAVHYAHEHGIVHRDLKPANVLLQWSDDKESMTEKGQIPLSSFVPKIADFGLAKQLGDAGRSLTVTGIVAGTPEYMAPEQRRSERATAASDVYALGLVARTAARGPLPPGLDAIVQRATRERPEERWPSAVEMAAALRATAVVP